MSKKNTVSNFSYRSGVETAWRCPRGGYLEQFYLGTGIVKNPIAYWLCVGSAVHLGLAEMLNCSSNLTPPHEEEMMDLARDAGRGPIGAALDYWDNCGQKEVLHEITFNEQRILIEALLWAFYYHSLRAFLETYEVLYVEKEVTEMVSGRPRYLMMSRPDAIVRDRTTGELVVISWKTIDDPNEWRRLFFKQDLQGMMEAWYAEQFLNGKSLNSHEAHKNEVLTRIQDAVGGGPPLRISYVQTIYLVKGKRAKLKENGSFGYDNSEDAEAIEMFSDTEGPRWRADSHLVYPYTNIAETVKCGECKGKGTREIKRCYACGLGSDGQLEKYRAGVGCPECNEGIMQWTMTNCAACNGTGKTSNDAFEFLSWKYRYVKPGNVSASTLGAAYKRVLITETSMSIREYVKALAAGEVFPTTMTGENALQKTIVWEQPSYRDPVMMQSMITQVKETERKRHRDKKIIDRAQHNVYLTISDDCSKDVEDLVLASYKEVLDKLFPQQLTSCNFPWRCSFADVVSGPCHSEKGRAAIHALKIPEGYVERQSHHEPEAEYRKGLVQIEGVKL